MQLRNLTILAANVLTQKIIAQALAKSMEDPSFKNSFDAANPGLMDKLKALVSANASNSSNNNTDGTDSNNNAENKAALLPSPEDLAKNIDAAFNLLNSNNQMNAATALDLLNGGSMDPKELISLSKDKLLETSADRRFDADNMALKSIQSGIDNPSQTSKETAIKLITQDPMASPVKDALNSLMAKIDALSLATGVINAAVSDSSFIDNMVDSDLANGLVLSPEEMRNALLNCLDGNEKVVSAITEALLGADAIDESEASAIVADILTVNKNDKEIVANASAEGSFNDKLEKIFSSASPISMAEGAENAARTSVNAASDEEIANAYSDACSNPDFLNALQELDANIRAKMMDALANKLSSLNGDQNENSTNSLADAFGQLSKEDLMKAIKQTLDLDKSDA